ncbi:hypothetical protein AAHC03_0195 [Spirometra sp. Aus1]
MVTWLVTVPKVAVGATAAVVAAETTGSATGAVVTAILHPGAPKPVGSEERTTTSVSVRIQIRWTENEPRYGEWQESQLHDYKQAMRIGTEWTDEGPMKTGSPVSRQISPVYVAGPRNSFTDTMRIHFVGQRDTRFSSGTSPLPIFRSRLTTDNFTTHVNAPAAVTRPPPMRVCAPADGTTRPDLHALPPR